MTMHKLSSAWFEMMKQSLKQFIDSHIGYKESDNGLVPKCSGTGDGNPWCSYCDFLQNC